MTPCLVVASPRFRSPSPRRPSPTSRSSSLCPFPPGGPIDTMVRFVAQSLAARLNQSAVVENEPGGGAIGTRAAAATGSDGSPRRPANSNAGAHVRSRLSCRLGS